MGPNDNKHRTLCQRVSSSQSTQELDYFGDFISLSLSLSNKAGNEKYHWCTFDDTRTKTVLAFRARYMNTANIC